MNNNCATRWGNQADQACPRNRRQGRSSKVEKEDKASFATNFSDTGKSVTLPARILVVSAGLQVDHGRSQRSASEDHCKRCLIAFTLFHIDLHARIISLIAEL